MPSIRSTSNSPWSGLSLANRFLAKVFIGLVGIYRYILSPWLGWNCRFLPTCSEYAIEALRRHGAARGVLLALRRIGRCHPCGGSGYDPVPEARIWNRESRKVVSGDFAVRDLLCEDSMSEPAPARVARKL